MSERNGDRARFHRDRKRRRLHRERVRALVTGWRQQAAEAATAHAGSTAMLDEGGPTRPGD